MSATIRYRNIEATYDGKAWTSSNPGLALCLNDDTEHLKEDRENFSDGVVDFNPINMVARQMVANLMHTEIVSLDQTYIHDPELDENGLDENGLPRVY